MAHPDRGADRMCHRADRAAVANSRFNDQAIVEYLNAVTYLRIHDARSAPDHAAVADHGRSLDGDVRVNDRIAAERGFDIEVVQRVIRMVDRAEYKRQQAAPGLKISPKAFGYGRRFPIAAKYEY